MIKLKNTILRLVLISLIIFFVCIGANYISELINVYREPNYMYIIDRFEGDFAVLERNDRTTINVPKDQLPAESKEGDVITDEWKINTRSTEYLLVQIGELFKKVYYKSSF